jgi:O-antigen biosynthesis protein
MESKWQKDYPSISNLSEAASDDNSSYNKMAQFIGQNQYVVDFGCATGYFPQLLGQKGCKVVGVEVNPVAAKAAEQYCDQVFVADLDFTPITDFLPTQTFDVAVFGDVLEHLRDPWTVLESVQQILKPNGYVVASIPNVAHGAVRLALLQGKFEYERFGLLDNTHLRFFTRETVSDLFEKTGYFIDDRSRTIASIFSRSEFIPQVYEQDFPSEVIQKVEQEEDSDTLQFIVRAFPLTLEGKFEALSLKYGETLAAYKRSQSQQNELHQTLEKVQTQAQAQAQDQLQQVQQYQTKFQQAQAEIDEHRTENQALREQLKESEVQLQRATTRFQWAQSQMKYSQTALGELEAQVRFFQGKIERSKSNLERARANVERLRGIVDVTQNQLEAIQTSKFWKLRTAWFKVKRLVGMVPSSEMFMGQETILSGQSDASANSTLPSQQTLPPSVQAPGQKMFAFISDCPGDAYRYRCQHQAEMLESLGYTVDVYEASKHPYQKLLKHYRVVVAHRVPHTHAFEEFVIKAKELGIKVVYETDDLVFDASRLHYVNAYMAMDKDPQKLYEDGVRRYCKSLSLCDYAIVSTDKLKQEIQVSFPGTRVAISRNRISRAMEEAATQAKSRYLSNDGVVRVAYFSGTKTHARDFAECVPALRKILQNFPQVSLVIVGHLDVPEELQEFSSQIEYILPMPWQSLPLVYRQIDINLAPLEHHNDFTEAKSELKYFEAGLLGVPTIASDFGAFQVAIQDGINGRLCQTTTDWEQALQDLITNGEARQDMGQAAFEDVTQRYLTRSAASETGAVWQQVISGSLFPDRPLTVAFVLRAPIAQTGGGYKKIFHLAHYLANQGHQVHLYIEPIAHLAGLSLQQIRRFCEEHFGQSNATIYRGHDEILESDVAIATNWPTAYTVAKLNNTRFKAYFVQDYEPHFYQPGDPCLTEAEATYDLPLSMISIGNHLAKILSQRNGIQYPHIDFSLDEAFLSEDPSLDRHQRSQQPCSILFFARPNIPRRNFSLGVKALTQLHEQAPEIKIKFYGMDEALELPFPYENLGILSQVETAAAMRHADIHLSFSMTNISTVIFEAMACGCATVEADVPPVRAMVTSEICVLTKPMVQDVCNALLTLATDAEKRRSVATAGFNAVHHLTTERMCSQFEAILQTYSFRKK